MKKIFSLILLPIILLSVFSGCTSKQITFNYSSKNIDKLVYDFDYNKAAPREIMDITVKEDIDRILDAFNGIIYNKSNDPLTTGIFPLSGYSKDKLIFSCFNDSNPLLIENTFYKPSSGQESKLITAEKNVVKILKELKDSGKYQIYTK
jgi:hypothetical protein